MDKFGRVFSQFIELHKLWDVGGVFFCWGGEDTDFTLFQDNYVIPYPSDYQGKSKLWTGRRNSQNLKSKGNLEGKEELWNPSAQHDIINRRKNVGEI